ncbi:ACS family glucarate transporter-like MFS transporter [Saccharopolyspora erythraea NRRL 2338]|uniref:MFS transporter, phthalate permease family n=2 Tax=Saccharopolyspora erythraea TaxID=1836 RepID=A4FIJ1_SACEN|nr:MFS transporter [Saccharopolyspora erythraea]EQD87858.1 glucarate transporter [Saccharopolyspora erythraea D]PFG97542.1 ACS family glucarate transporter-like MFS transporter [Saccharopolyspora erythraea NRRL 2338]QRK87714.1 MFS transporter [Saccharopolyspora erythraea]CAM03866.1 MFS transporter, phthalate permease family [Saccharopolyspora erythraea NRRL 2338]
MSDNTTASSGGQTAAPATTGRRVPTRYLVLALIFIITALNYADRSSLSITGTSLQEDLGFSSVQLGYIFSAFSWAYVVGQIPGGILLDRFGARRVYALILGLWTLVTAAISLVGLITTPVLVAVTVIFVLRLLLGVFESPAFPANARVATAWFPTAERGRATAVFNSAQYFATALFAPVMGWVTHQFGWRWVFVLLGVLGVVLAVVWLRWMDSPRHHPRVTPAELETITAGGGLVDLDAPKTGTSDAPKLQRARLDRRTIAKIFSTRALWGVYVSQYAVNALTYFFITWFPVYLVQGRGLSLLEVGFVAALPALCGFAGGLAGGFFSDAMLRRGYSLTAARKVPSVIGMGLATSIALCSLTDSSPLIIAIMTLAFFGKGLGSLGWAITTDIAPPQATSFVGSTMNAFGNVAGIVTPIVIGYTVQATGSFNTALWFVAAHGLLSLVGLAAMGTIRRIQFDEP